MKTGYTRCLIVAMLIVTYVACKTVAFAQSERGTLQQREACTPDVFRLCGAYIPDADRITACLRASGPRLSQPCYDVFFPAPPPQYAPDVDPRRRYQRSPPPRGPYYEDDDN